MKIKIKNKKALLLMVGSIIVIIFLAFLIFGNRGKSDANIFKKEYEKLNEKKECNNNSCLKININKNNKIQYTNAEKIKKIIDDKDSAAVYIGTPNCQYCRSVAELIVESANETDIKTIYYYKNDTSNADYQNMLDNLENLFKDNNKIKEPIVLFIIDGKVVTYKIGTIYSHKDPNVSMDKSGKEGLKDIYKYGMDLVIKAKKIKEKAN